MAREPRSRTSPRLSWALLDEAAKDLACRRNRNEHELGDLLVRAQDARIERPFGWTFHEWAERRFGLGRRAVEERLRVARSLRWLPALARMSEVGEATFSVVRELTRVATAETEADWIDATRARTATEVQRTVAGRTRGDTPTDPPDRGAELHRWTVALPPQAMGLRDQARTKLTKELGHAVTDEELLGAAFAALLESSPSERSRREPAEVGRAAFQLVMTRCESCRHAEYIDGSVATAGEVDAAECDAQVIPREGRASQTIPPATKRAIHARAGHRCEVPGCTHRRFLQIHHLERRADGGTHEPSNLILLCGTHHTGAHSGALVVRRDASDDLVFEHADGTPYGSGGVSVDRAELLRDSFEALRSLHFGEREARRMLDAVRTAVRDGDGIEDVVRYALRAAPSRWSVREVEPTYERVA